jgi:hypothetical protein
MESLMSEYPPTRTSDTVDRLRRWLLARPAESWLFLTAGIILGTLLR